MCVVVGCGCVAGVVLCGVWVCEGCGGSVELYVSCSFGVCRGGYGVVVTLDLAFDILLCVGRLCFL